MKSRRGSGEKDFFEMAQLQRQSFPTIIAAGGQLPGFLQGVLVSAPFVTLATAVIEQTFLHLPGVGRKTEHRLWQVGFRSWGKLRDALSNGVRPRDLFNPRRRDQQLLFPSPYVTRSDKRCAAWLDALEESERALREQHFAYFLERLNAGNYWRVLAPFLDAALYLDIETTGLTKDLNYMTVIGALHANRFHQWVWPEPLDLLKDLIRQAPLVVTFNGARFDIPFLRHQADEVPAPRAHVDLLYLARAAGHAGGQKEVEEQVGLTRPVEVQGLEGKEAVALWCNALCGDRASFGRLLQYNETDVTMLPRLAERLCNKLAGGLGTGATASCAALPAVESVGYAPSSFTAVQRAWEKRRCGLHLLGPNLQAKLGREPVVVGIDLRGNPRNPTGWAQCCEDKTETRVVYDDADILALTKAAKPDLVSIDAPLSLPRGRVSVSDDSPCRKAGGIVRDAERVLWSKGIRVYPALIRHMQGLTERGIRLAAELQQAGIPVIESYPGAAQDILGIARKRYLFTVKKTYVEPFLTRPLDFPENNRDSGTDNATCRDVSVFQTRPNATGLRQSILQDSHDFQAQTTKSRNVSQINGKHVPEKRRPATPAPRALSVWLPDPRRKNARRVGCHHVGSGRVFLSGRGLRGLRGRGRRLSHCAKVDCGDAVV